MLSFTQSHPTEVSKANHSRETWCSMHAKIWKVDTKRAFCSRLTGCNTYLDCPHIVTRWLSGKGSWGRPDISFFSLHQGRGVRTNFSTTEELPGKTHLLYASSTSRPSRHSITGGICLCLRQFGLPWQNSINHMAYSNTNSFFTVRGAGSPRPRVQTMWFLLRTTFWLTDRYLPIVSSQAENISFPLQGVSTLWCLFL